jgi:hypothetical protein
MRSFGKSTRCLRKNQPTKTLVESSQRLVDRIALSFHGGDKTMWRKSGGAQQNQLGRDKSLCRQRVKCSRDERRSCIYLKKGVAAHLQELKKVLQLITGAPLTKSPHAQTTLAEGAPPRPRGVSIPRTLSSVFDPFPSSPR